MQDFHVKKVPLFFDTTKKLMDSQIVIPEAILTGNPDGISFKSWMPDTATRV